MDIKVLVTGNNKNVAMDICDHLEDDRGYRTLKCAPNNTSMFEMLISELPKVVIICLNDETAETIAAYDILSNAANQGNFTTLVITNEEDEKMFVKYTKLERVYFLSRPISLFALYEKLNEIEEKIEEERLSNLASVREFVNEDYKDSGRRKKILVVDDDTEQLMMIRGQLEEFYDVTLVKSGDAAFKALLKKTPDLILLDYLMPEMDGPDVLSQMRMIDEYA